MTQSTARGAKGRARFRHSRTEPKVPNLLPDEALLLMLVSGLAVATVAMSAVFAQPVAWADFLPAYATGAFAVVVGVMARRRGSMQRLALFMVGAGLYVGFAAAIALTINLQFPLARPLVDAEIARIDQLFGYSWPNFVDALASYPVFGRLAGLVYLSSLAQLTLVLAVLAFSAHAAALHRFLMVGFFGATLTVAVWVTEPSFGPSTLFDIPAETAARIGLVVDSAYGRDLLRLGAEGSPVVTAMSIRGVVAFPSFHTVMACMVVWFSFRTWLFLPAVVVNLIMVPGILAHGAHHLLDMVGGVVVFALTLWATGFLQRRTGRGSGV